MSDSILELIPQDEISPRQTALLPAKYKDRFALHRLLWEPTHLDEIDWESCDNIAIWRDNGTIMCLYKGDSFCHEEPSAVFMIDHPDKDFPECVVYGETKASIAETVTFLWSFKPDQECKIGLVASDYIFDGVDSPYDFSILQPEQLARILDANPHRNFSFHRGVWNAAKSVVLATRHGPLTLHLGDSLFGNEGFAFDDGGTVFVDALEKRQSTFGSLSIKFATCESPFSRANLERLFRLDVFEILKMRVLSNEYARLPFTAKANALEYEIVSFNMQPAHFDDLEVVTKDLQLKVSKSPENENWEERPIAFLNRAAELDHFERLCVLEKLHVLRKALIRAVGANPNLKSLSLDHASYQYLHECVDWTPHLQSIFEAVEVHKCLRTLVARTPLEDPSYHWLERLLSRNRNMIERLLSRNRNITVLDYAGDRISNGISIDKLYALNRFFNGSAELIKESPCTRPALVGTTLMESAIGNFQFSALLLSNHVDVLCEFIACRSPSN